MPAPGYQTLAEPSEAPLFKELSESNTQAFLQGSARIALAMNKPFGEYLLIEKRAGHVAELERLRAAFPDRRIRIAQGDANHVLQDWIQCTDWQRTRAVVFLDPYGMQVEWSLIKAIADTQAIDLWLLFPFGMGVNRLLTKEAPPPVWEEKLTRFFGTDEWRDRFYQRQIDMFGNVFEPRLANAASIKQFFIERLATIFAAVAPNPLVLTNSRNNPLYLLCFAAGNPKGAQTALKIAQHILGHTP
ncbi:three-Cys-motif partner protein TcmP [Chloroflexus sp.]|uniref:three-Cys-motif partner protein TcmP n=1 Tax=Chloroflexus sp. TaxID=1904827 RepID=UPI002ACE65B7|nr:three-Cys-motif partner protein TcmP [Chloroflexus sp.]